jgi:hypothetical protein
VDSKVPAIYRRMSVKYWPIVTLTFVVIVVGVLVVAFYQRLVGRVGRHDEQPSAAGTSEKRTGRGPHASR